MPREAKDKVEAEAPSPEEMDLPANRTEIDEQGRLKNAQSEGTVRFNPQMATVRIIRVDEWPVGAEHEDDRKKIDAIWDLSNGYELPTDMFTARQLQVLRQDGNFTVVE